MTHWSFVSMRSIYFQNDTKKIGCFMFHQVLYYYFLLLICIRESIVFGSNFRTTDFDGFTRFEVHQIRKSYFQQFVSVCSFINIPQKQITSGTSDLVFETFQEHTKEF